MSKAEKRAKQLLEKIGVSHPPVDVRAVAEGEGLIVRYERLENTVSGLLLRNKAGRIIIGVNSSHHENRQRFTIAHEIGHFLLHPSEPRVIVDDLMVYFRDDASSNPSDRRETEANAFAAALLMPEAFLMEDLKRHPVAALDEVAVRDLAQRYAVSQQALTIRLMSLGFMSGLA